MPIIPIQLRTRQAMPALGEQINQFLAKKKLPKFWLGGNWYPDDYRILFRPPRGSQTAYRIAIVYHPNQVSERTFGFDRGWELPLSGPLSPPSEDLITQPEPPEAAPEPSDAAPEPAPTPRRRSTRRPAATTPPDPEPEATGEE